MNIKIIYIMTEKLEKLEKYVSALDTMPDWGYINGVEMEGSVININYCDTATIYFDTEFGCVSGLSIKENCALGRWDVEYVLDVLKNREKILSFLN